MDEMARREPSALAAVSVISYGKAVCCAVSRRRRWCPAGSSCASSKTLRWRALRWSRQLPAKASEAACRSMVANHSFVFVMIGSSTTASPSLRMRTSSPWKRNSCGRRTAWLLPLRKELSGLGHGVAFRDAIYMISIYSYNTSAHDSIPSFAKINLGLKIGARRPGWLPRAAHHLSDAGAA